MTPTVNFDRATATVQRGRFSGNYSLWKDADGNLQLVCISDHTGGRVLELSPNFGDVRAGQAAVAG